MGEDAWLEAAYEDANGGDVDTANMWGTDIEDIDADEFCPLCEREVPWHYASCPSRR